MKDIVFDIELNTYGKCDSCSSSSLFTGHIIKRDEFWFEGIVKNDILKEKDLIIGCLINNRIILMKYNNLSFGTHIFTAISSGEKLNGNITLETPDHYKYPLEECEILVSESKINEEDITILEHDINHFKIHTNDYNKKMIEEVFKNKQDIMLNLLKTYLNAPIISLNLNKK